MPTLTIRGVLAIGIVAGGLVLLGLHTITFDQTLALTGPVTALYFGQYISPPGQAPAVVIANKEGGQSLVQVLVAVALVLVIIVLLRTLGAV